MKHLEKAQVFNQLQILNKKKLIIELKNSFKTYYELKLKRDPTENYSFRRIFYRTQHPKQHLHFSSNAMN